MSTKSISMNEANLISWFNGQVALIENQTGAKVEKLSLEIDRTQSEDIQITLTFAPVEVPPAE